MWNQYSIWKFVSISILVSFIIWGVAGAKIALIALTLQLLVLHLRHLRQVYILAKWLDTEKGELPNANGVWGHIFALSNKLLDQKKQIENEFAGASDTAKELAKTLPDGLILLDENYDVVWFNPAAQKFFDLTSSDIRKNVTFIFRQPEFKKLLPPFKNKESLQIKLKKPFNDILIAIEILDQGSDTFLVLAKDISANERIRDTRRNFIADVSHELRTPLTVIHGFLETLENSKNRDEILKQAIPLMSEQTVRMTRLIEDLLTLTKVEIKVSKNEEPVDIPKIINSMVNEIESLPDTKHKISIFSCAPIWVKGNSEELRSAFENLLSNAVRYTKKGGTIQVGWEKFDSHARFTVKDNGVGINSLHIPRITERFYRVDEGRSRKTGGTGLGLAIVKHISNRHQAKLNIESKEGIGSSFFIDFPRCRCIRPD